MDKVLEFVVIGRRSSLTSKIGDAGENEGLAFRYIQSSNRCGSSLKEVRLEQNFALHYFHTRHRHNSTKNK